MSEDRANTEFDSEMLARKISENDTHDEENPWQFREDPAVWQEKLDILQHCHPRIEHSL
jgi:hypothetical protein